jgi:hypothetical protein
MQASTIKKHLEIITNVAVLLTAIGVLSALSWGYFVQRHTPSLHDGFRKGQVIAGLPKVDYSGAPKHFSLP